jgi:hypothetical protein
MVGMGRRGKGLERAKNNVLNLQLTISGWQLLERVYEKPNFGLRFKGFGLNLA